jgi:hypothetical protein
METASIEAQEIVQASEQFERIVAREPDNARHAVERAIILGEGSMLEADDFPLTAPRASLPVTAASDASSLEDIERNAIARTDFPLPELARVAHYSSTCHSKLRK